MNARGEVAGVSLLLLLPLACSSGGSTPSPQDSGASDAGLTDSTTPDVAAEASLDAGGDTVSAETEAGEASVEAGGEAAVEAATEGSASDAAPDAQASLCGATCPSGQKSCWGRCVPESDPMFGCSGSSCMSCSPPHAVPSCGTNGACAIASCETGWADCDGLPGNGCEADLSSPQTCTQCSATCVGSTPYCSPTGCVASCSPPLTACAPSGSSVKDRCVSLSSSSYNCGACGTGCGVTGSGFATCSGGTCGVSCWSGSTNCGIPSGGAWPACMNLQESTWTSASNGVASGITGCGTCSTICQPPANGFPVCRSGACGTTCPLGWTLCGSSCVTTQTDPLNCGGCSHACGSGEFCGAGSCLPSSSVWLVTGLTTPGPLALDASRLYFADMGAGTIGAVPKSGGSVVTLASGQAKPVAIAVDTDSVYWSDNLGGAIMRAPKDGSAAASVVASTTSPGALAVDDTNVYWVDGSANLMKAPKSGGTPVSACSACSGVSNAVLVAGSQLYFSTGTFERLDLDSGVVSPTCTGDRPYGSTDSVAIAMAADTTNFYWPSTMGAEWQGRNATLIDDDAGFHCGPAGTPLPNSIFLGNAPDAAASGWGEAVNSCANYWTTGAGALQMAIPPGAPIGSEPLYPVTIGGTTAKGVVADEAAIYWSDRTAIGKLPLP